MTKSENQEIMKLENVSKEYFGVPALRNVSFEIKKGEIHGLIGENGAGKSTLIKAISGAIQLTAGDVYFENEKLNIKQPIDAINLGIGVVYQEFNLFPNLSVYENIYFGVEIKRNGMLDRASMINGAKEIIKDLGFDFDVRQQVKILSTAYQQITEIAKCLNHKVKLMIMDEPSAPLTENEVEDMFRIVKRLNNQRVTFIYISHKLNEIMDITDRITVLRDSQYIKTIETMDATEDLLIKLMVGREIIDIYPEKNISNHEVVLKVDGLGGGILNDVSFELKRGEILGFGGLVGAGRTELVRLLFGADPKRSGVIYIKGEKANINSPKDAIVMESA